MIDCLMDGLFDTLKLIPYLFIAFLILEYLEHKLGDKTEKILSKTNIVGPIIGGVLGALPQCGFSTMASNLFSNGIITTGTLIAIFLSTSDEMLPIMFSEKVDFKIIFSIIAFKVIIGIVIGFIIDMIYRRKKMDSHHEIHHHCESDDCHCKEKGIFFSSMIHTIKISFFILLFTVILNIIIYFIGEEQLSQLLLQKNILAYFLASLIGLIPNCASSVIITELYLSHMISLGVLLSGLLTGSGLGILFLFKENKNKKENMMILVTIYIIGVVIGMIVDLFL